MATKSKRRAPAKAKPSNAARKRPSTKPSRPARPKSAAAPKKPAARPVPKPSGKPKSTDGGKAPVAPEPEVLVPRGDGRRHVLSLSFLRDGDEFLARLETDGGEITELKNRSLDQLLTLVANELEDLLE